MTHGPLSHSEERAVEDDLTLEEDPFAGLAINDPSVSSEYGTSSYPQAYREFAAQQGVTQGVGVQESAFMSQPGVANLGALPGISGPDNLAEFGAQRYGAISGTGSGYQRYGIMQPSNVLDNSAQYWNFRDGHPQAGVGLGELHQLLLFSGFLELSADKLATFDWNETNDKGWKAWKDAVKFAANEGVPVMDYLQQRAAAALESGKLEGLLGAGDDSRPAPRISLSDPAALRTVADRVGQAILGRKATDEEKADIIAAIHSAEREAGSVTEGAVVDPNPTARIEEQLRADNPVEAGGMDMFGAYQGLVEQLFGGGS